MLFLLLWVATVADSLGPHRVLREFAVTVRMSDGVALATDIYRPDTTAKVPAILVRTPYGRTSLGNYRMGHYWASHGYAYVVQDVRGRGDSDGRFDPLVDEGRDGYRTQSWIAAQRWSNGTVGSWGGSYLGWTQVFAAALDNPALKAMIPMVTPSDPGGYWPTRQGGISFGMVEWAMVVHGRTVRSLPDDEAELLPSYMARPLDVVDQRIGARSPIWQSYLANLHNEAYWTPRSYQSRLPRSGAAMLHVTGWYDGTLGGSLENFVTMRAKARPATREAQYLLVGPWRHWVDADAVGTVVGGMDFGPGVTVNTFRQYRLWYDRYLKHADNEVTAWPRVRVFALGTNRWLGADDWPLPGTRFTRYYAAGGQAGHADAGGLTPSQPASETATKYDYDPANPTPFLWTKNVDSGGPDDYRPVEARADVVVYTMESPREPLAVCGPIRATVTASSSARDTDWVARLSLVKADGYSQRLTEGWVRARARRGNFRNDPLVPGKAETYDLDLWGTCVVVSPGERLRLAVSSAAFPLLAPNLNTGGNLARETRGVVAHQTVREGPTTYLTLPIVPVVRTIDTP